MLARVESAMVRLRRGSQGHARLPQMTAAMFIARSRPGRRVKIVLFGLGALLPAGSLIWALLALHGNVVGRSMRREKGP